MKIFTKLNLGVVAVVGALAAICLAGTARAELIVNGGFETGDFSGWTQSGNTGFTLVTTSNPNSGAFAAALGPVGSLGFLDQTIPTLSGEHYIFSFWVASGDTGPNSFQAQWDGGAPVLTLTNFTQAYTQYNFDVVAPGTATSVTFGFQDNPSFLSLDDVSVNLAVPEPEIYAMMGIGLLLMGFVARRRKGQTAA